MASNLAFDDVARNLLVFLKGQIPALQNKQNKDEVSHQIQSIIFTLRSSIIQLESATYNAEDAQQNEAKLQNEIEELKKENIRLERCISLEKLTVKDLTSQLYTARESMAGFDEAKSGMEIILNSQKEENKRLREEIERYRIDSEKYKTDSEKFRIDSEKYRNQYEKHRLEYDSLKEEMDNQISSQLFGASVVTKLKSELAEIESQLSDSRTETATLKQALQNKEIELRKAKETLMDAIQIDKTELDDLKTQLQSFDLVKNENKMLKNQIASLQEDIKKLPSKEEYNNSLTSMTTKLKFLEESLFNSQTELKKAKEQLNSNNPVDLMKEKASLEQKVTSLETTLSKVIAAREAEQAKTDNIFKFNPDECIFLFQTLTATVRRLQESLENKDIFLRSKESISLLEKAKAVTKVPTVGQQLDTRIHKVTRSFRADFLPDEMIIFEESSGFVSGSKLIQKAVVWISKSRFVCSECGKVSKPHELFCPQCGYELTCADGTTKRDIPAYPNSLEISLPLLDEMMRQGNVKASAELMNLISKISPNNPEIVKKQAILSRVDPNFSMYPTLTN